MTRPSGALPKYLQISELLIREIAAGRLLDGQRLPPEREMADGLHSSVGTLRKALGELSRRGLLVSIQGSGNYIRHSGNIDGVYAMFRLELLEGGGLPRAEILSVDPMPKPDDLPPFGTSSAATRIRRLRSLNTVPVALEEIWLDAGAGRLSREMISDSLYRTYHARFGFWTSRAEDRIGIGRVPSWTPDSFGKSAGDVTGFVERRSWAGISAEPFEFSRTWFDTDRAVYVQRMK